MLYLALALNLLLPTLAVSCPGLSPPVTGAIVREYAPDGRYAGHWGVDFAAHAGTQVRAAYSGTVTFAGSVAGVLSVTVHHGGGLRTSYSYLSEVSVESGQLVGSGEVIGTSGIDHGRDAVHFSVRIGDEYQDPHRWLGCFAAPHRGLSLIPVTEAYAFSRATRHSRRYIRSSPPCSSLRW